MIDVDECCRSDRISVFICPITIDDGNLHIHEGQIDYIRSCESGRTEFVVEGLEGQHFIITVFLDL